jgi:hypothetical protein
MKHVLPTVPSNQGLARAQKKDDVDTCVIKCHDSSLKQKKKKETYGAVNVIPICNFVAVSSVFHKIYFCNKTRTTYSKAQADVRSAVGTEEVDKRGASDPYHRASSWRCPYL